MPCHVFFIFFFSKSVTKQWKKRKMKWGRDIWKRKHKTTGSGNWRKKKVSPWKGNWFITILGPAPTLCLYQFSQFSLIFYHKDKCSRFLRDVGKFLPVYMGHSPESLYHRSFSLRMMEPRWAPQFMQIYKHYIPLCALTSHISRLVWLWPLDVFLVS